MIDELVMLKTKEKKLKKNIYELNKELIVVLNKITILEHENINQTKLF